MPPANSSSEIRPSAHHPALVLIHSGMTTAPLPAASAPGRPGCADAGGIPPSPPPGSTGARAAPIGPASYRRLPYGTGLFGLANPSAPYISATAAALRSDGVFSLDSSGLHVGRPSSMLHIRSPALLNAWPRPMACMNSCAAVAAASAPVTGPRVSAMHTTVCTGMGRCGSSYIRAQPAYSSRHPASLSGRTRLTTTSGRPPKNGSPGSTTSNATPQSPPYRRSMDDVHVSMPSWAGAMYRIDSAGRSGLGAIATSGGPSRSIE